MIALHFNVATRILTRKTHRDEERWSQGIGRDEDESDEAERREYWGVLQLGPNCRQDPLK
jgi:hypothetical protein